MYAWLGHDIHHHHPHSHGPNLVQHLSQAEATHTKAVQPGSASVAPQTLIVALLVRFCDFALPQLLAPTEAPDFLITLLAELQVGADSSSPRAPPALLV